MQSHKNLLFTYQRLLKPLIADSLFSGSRPQAEGLGRFKKQKTPHLRERFWLWAHTDSNRGPSACKADALNQLSYAPDWDCKYSALRNYAKPLGKNFMKNLIN